MRAALRQHALDTRDLGFLPEAEVHRRSQGTTPLEMGRDSAKYPLEEIMVVADQAASFDATHTPALRAALTDSESAVRYWAATGLLIRGEPAVRAALVELRQSLKDEIPVVRIAAAEALARHGEATDLDPALDVLLKAARVDEQGMFVALQALNALAQLGPKRAALREEISQLPTTDPSLPARLREYVPRLVGWLNN